MTRLVEQMHGMGINVAPVTAAEPAVSPGIDEIEPLAPANMGGARTRNTRTTNATHSRATLRPAALSHVLPRFHGAEALPAGSHRTQTITTLTPSGSSVALPTDDHVPSQPSAMPYTMPDITQFPAASPATVPTEVAERRPSPAVGPIMAPFAPLGSSQAEPVGDRTKAIAFEPVGMRIAEPTFEPPSDQTGGQASERKASQVEWTGQRIMPSATAPTRPAAGRAFSPVAQAAPFTRRAAPFASSPRNRTIDEPAQSDEWSGTSESERVSSSATEPRQGILILDGAQVGRWIVDHLARQASRPGAGTTGIDPRINAIYPGAFSGA